MNKKLILASASPRRRALLQKLGVPFEIFACDVDEHTDLAPAAAVVALSERKARAAAAYFTEGIILGADTLVAWAGRALGKPKDREEAKTMLRALSGNLHEVYTGLCLFDAATGRCACRAECTQVCFRTLDEAEIEAYVESGEPMDKAGAYAIQGGAGAFVTEIRGAFDNVMGLPVAALTEMLESFGG